MMVRVGGQLSPAATVTSYGFVFFTLAVMTSLYTRCCHDIVFLQEHFA